MLEEGVVIGDAQLVAEARPGEVQLAQAAWGQKGGQLVVVGVLVGDAQLVAEAHSGRWQVPQACIVQQLWRHAAVGGA